MRSSPSFADGGVQATFLLIVNCKLNETSPAIALSTRTSVSIAFKRFNCQRLWLLAAHLDRSTTRVSQVAGKLWQNSSLLHPATTTTTITAAAELHKLFWEIKSSSNVSYKTLSMWECAWWLAAVGRLNLPLPPTTFRLSLFNSHPPLYIRICS